jgi:zinc/manganese transport system substrate-binding protein
MTSLAREVGGDDVVVVQLIDAHDNPHQFSPTPQVLANAKGASIYLASGKGLEPYLGKLRDTLGDFARVVEVGAGVPSQKVLEKDAHHLCCPAHSHGAVDPHWWHNISHMKRAARVVAREFSYLDPENADSYRKRTSEYISRLTALESWARRKISQIPREQRVLATAHAAFGYFCKAYGFKSLPVKGISSTHQISAAYQAEAIKAIREHNVAAIFPERRANPKAIEVITKETGVKLGEVLVADGAENYERMMRANISNIVRALAP